MRRDSTTAGAPFRSLPPGPPLPVPVQTALWMYFPMQFMKQCAARYGDTFTVRLAGLPPLVFFSDPESIKDVFTGDPHVLHAGEANSVLKPLLGAHSLLLLDGDRHLRERKLMLPPFHGERMAAYGEIIARIADRTLATIPVKRKVALHPYMQEITLDVILRAVLGVEEGGDYARLRELMRAAMAFGDRPALLLLVTRDGDFRFPRLQETLGRFNPWVRFRAIQDEIDALLYAEFARRRRDRDLSKRQDVLSMLMLAKDEGAGGEGIEGSGGEGSDRQGRMSDQQLRDEMMTLLVAGHETSATTLTWATWRLLTQPDVLARLRSLDGEEAEDYADAVVRETLRLNPIIPLVGRVVKKPVTIGGVSLPEGAVAAPCIYLAQRRAASWPDPERFDPDRFLGKKVSPYEWLPFGGGTRRCLGLAFAMYEMRIALPKIARLPLRLAPGYRMRMSRRGVTFAVSGGLPVVRSS
jgi:cytochrome P450